VHAIEPGELTPRERQGLGLHRPPLPDQAGRTRDPSPPRRLPRPPEPGLHRVLLRETERTGGVAERVRDGSPRAPWDAGRQRRHGVNLVPGLGFGTGETPVRHAVTDRRGRRPARRCPKERCFRCPGWKGPA